MGFYSDGTLPITNCLGSAQVLWEQLQMWGYTPRYCYMYLEKGEQREPTDHVIPIVEIDDRIYMIDPHLKNTTLFALPEEWRDPVEIIFDANGVDGSGSGSHITTYTRLDKNRIRVERRNGSGDKVFQLRILDLNPRNDLEDLWNFFEAGRHVLKYEQYIRTIDGTEFNFMFRSDPKNDGSGEYVSKIVIGTTQYSESQFEEAKTELVQRMGENWNVLFDDLLSTRDTFIDSRKDTPEPTPAQIQQFSLTDSQ